MTTEDTELAEAIANLRRGTEIRLAALEEGRVSVGTGRFLATIVRAVLARPGLLTDPAIALVGTRDGARSYMAMTDALGQIAEMVGLPADVDEDDAIVSGVRQALARPAAGRDLTDVEDDPTAVELLDDNERLGAALVDIGIAVGLPRPSATVRWGAPEILARIATLDSESRVPPRATARIAQARTDQTEGYGSTTSTVEGLLRELNRRAAELLRLRAALARPAVARTDGQCTCGDPSAADLVHHTEAPCRTVEELRTGRTDGQPHPDPRGRYDVPDPYDHPGWPLVSRIVAIATDTAPTMPNETDGVDNAVTGLLADQSWRDHVAMADVMGLVGDWGTDDVVQAVTDALHEYPRLRALVARTDGQPPADEPRAILPHDWARREVLFLAREVVQYRGSQLEGAKLDQLAAAITTLDETVAEYRASRLTAAPADDTAAPDAAPRPDWSGAWAELTGYVRAATEPIDPARIDAYMVELKREALRPFREWWEQLAAGQPVRGGEDGGA